MSDGPSPADRKRSVAASFDAMAPSYDALRFVRRSAERLVELAAVSPGARVLDVATGTGFVALAAAAQVGAGGSVTGIDLSPAMLERARHKAAAAGLAVTFQVGDAERLEFADGSFDLVLCASSLFFVPDMICAVREWRRVLAPGGWAVFCSYGPAFLQPGKDRWAACLRRHGSEAPFPPVQRLGQPARCEELLRLGGFAQIEVREEQLGYHATPGERWDEIAAGAEGAPLLALPAEERERIRSEHLAELSAAASEAGLWVDVPALFASGRAGPAAPDRLVQRPGLG